MICAIYKYAHKIFFSHKSSGHSECPSRITSFIILLLEGQTGGKKTRSLKGYSRSYENMRKKLKAGLCLLCPTVWGQSGSNNLGGEKPYSHDLPLPTLCYQQRRKILLLQEREITHNTPTSRGSYLHLKVNLHQGFPLRG